MSNSTRWYCTRESVKAAVGISGALSDALIDSKLESASEDIERMLGGEHGRQFIPITATKYFRWPNRQSSAIVLRFPDEDLIAVTTLKTQAQDSSPTTISSSDYFVEPVNQGPPYNRIEIDLSSDSSFDAGDTPQRSIQVTGRWGYTEATKAAGALAEALDNSETAVDVSDASLIGVGDTLLIETEAMFVSGRSTFDTTADLNDTLTADEDDQTVTVTDGTKVKAGEAILIDAERMLVRDITGNNLQVIRAYDGTRLAAHSGAGVNVYAYRTLTVVRGVNGTTAASHADTTAISKYAPPADIVELCQAEAIAHLKQDASGWTGQISGGEGAVPVRMVDLFYLRERVQEKYGRVTL